MAVACPLRRACANSLRPRICLLAGTSAPLLQSHRHIACGVPLRNRRWVYWPRRDTFFQPLAGSHRQYYAKPQTEVLANQDIVFPYVRVVDKDGNLQGDFPIGVARQIAGNLQTDLVLVDGTVQPPLCQIINIEEFKMEQVRKSAEYDERRQKQLLREFSFDPALKIKGVRIRASILEPDLERKVNQARYFLEKGHRVHVQLLKGKSAEEDVADIALRICAEVRDIAKPADLEGSAANFHLAGGREMILKLWPCTPAQAAAFQLPSAVVGPRRRHGGVQSDPLDDEPEDWELSTAKPGSRKTREFRGHRKPHRRDLDNYE